MDCNNNEYNIYICCVDLYSIKTTVPENMKSTPKRLDNEVIEYIESKTRDNEGFNDTLRRILGLKKGHTLKKQLARNPELTRLMDVKIANLFASGVCNWDDGYMKFYKEIEDELIANHMKELHPELWTKSANGQTRLAHIVRSRHRSFKADRMNAVFKMNSQKNR